MTAIAVAAGALLSSCAYDSYYGSRSTVSSSVGYSSNRGVSSSVFIRTSNNRWGYDPNCRSYYDYSRNAYYCPWLRGYYPRGYRPTLVVGMPHPRGWAPGRSVCPPPVNVRNYNLRDYRNRHHHVSQLNHSWCNNLRVSSNHNHSNRHYTNHYNPSAPHSNSRWNRTYTSSNNSSCNSNQSNRSNRYTNNNSSNRNHHSNRNHNRPQPPGLVESNCEPLPSSHSRKPSVASNPPVVKQPRPTSRPSSSQKSNQGIRQNKPGPNQTAAMQARYDEIKKSMKKSR